MPAEIEGLHLHFWVGHPTAFHTALAIMAPELDQRLLNSKHHCKYSLKYFHDRKIETLNYNYQ